MDKLQEQNAYLRMLLKFFHIKATGGADAEFAKLVDCDITENNFREIVRKIEAVFSEDAE